MERPSAEPFDDSTTSASHQEPSLDASQLHDQESDDSDNQTSPPPSQGAAATPKPNLPLQKRRRVTRACDECRRKKIKCDGKQPCTHCTVYSYDCTYDQPSNRRRNAQPQYIEALEAELKRAKSVISTLLPNANIDLKDPALDAKLQAGVFNRMPHNAHPAISTGLGNVQNVAETNDGQDPGRLESMVKAAGNLDLDEQGYYDYHGNSSGLSFIRRMREQLGQLGDMIGPEGHATPFVKTRPLSMVFESPKSLDSPMDSASNLHGVDVVDLPSKEEALVLCNNAIIDATAIMRFVHLPSFYVSLGRMYELTPDNYAHEDQVFLPLLYATLATGALFSKDDTELDRLGYESAIDKGFKYFQSSRKLLDIAECRDLPSIQAVLFMILFLQGSAKLSTCYSYIGVAIRSALRLGLHRSFNSNFNCIEQETRKRVFWSIRKLDLYVGALIGLPFTLGDEDIDQDLPTEVDDEYILEDKVLPFPQDKVSVMTAFNHHTRLMNILGKIVRHIYPIKGTVSTKNGLAGQNYAVSLATIRGIESDLEQWREALPFGLRPGGDTSPLIFRCQHTLRMSFAHAQMMLYRPFLHYVSDKYRSKDLDQRAHACAIACVSVARNIVQIAGEMKKKHLLVGAYWSTMYSTFFAIMALTFFVLQNPDEETSQQVLKDAQDGKDTLAKLAKRSLAADRCSATLAGLFEQLPEHLRKGGSSASRKRRAFASRPTPLSSSQPDLSVSDDDPAFFKPRRAATFPENLSNHQYKQPFPFPSAAQQQLSHLGFDYQNSPQLSSGLDSTPTMTPPSVSSIPFGRPSSQQRQQHSPFPGTPTAPVFSNNPELSQPVTDMSALMFPSADPFAYPKQPMTTFENNGHPFQIPNEADVDIQPQFGFHNSSAQSAINASMLQNQGNQMVFPNANPQEDVQLFGTMPMYLMQHSGTHHQPFSQNPNPHQFPGTPTQSSPSMNENFGPEFIGDEWSTPFMAQPYGGMGYQG